jgi:hypothetical protein
MMIGIVPDPLNWPDWPAIKAFLEPAAKRGGVPVLEADEVVFAVYGQGLEGAATARLTVEDFGEVVLVGGKDHRRWIHELDRAIGDAMRDAGMKTVRAYGRKGWSRVLKGWVEKGSANGNTFYERAL